MRGLLLLASLLASNAWAQDVGSTMYAAADVGSKRFPDGDSKGPDLKTGDEVTVVFVEGGLVRVAAGTHYGWVPSNALTATDPTPDAAPTGAETAPKEFSMEALQELLERTRGGGAPPGAPPAPR